MAVNVETLGSLERRLSMTVPAVPGVTGMVTATFVPSDRTMPVDVSGTLGGHHSVPVTAPVFALGEQIGPKSVITYPSGSQHLPGPGYYEISGLAWSGGGAIKTVEVSTDGGKKWNRAVLKNTPQRMAHVRRQSRGDAA